MNFRTVYYYDFRYGYCKDNIKITMAEVHTIRGDITNWKSKQQDTVTLLSTKANYITLLKAAKE